MLSQLWLKPMEIKKNILDHGQNDLTILVSS